MSTTLPGNFPKPLQFIANNCQKGSICHSVTGKKKSGTKSQLEELERMKKKNFKDKIKGTWIYSGSIHLKSPNFITDKEIKESPWGNQSFPRSYSKTSNQFLFIECLPTERKAVCLRVCFGKFENSMPVSMGTINIWETFPVWFSSFSLTEELETSVRQEPHLLKRRRGWNTHTGFIYWVDCFRIWPTINRIWPTINNINTVSW